MRKECKKLKQFIALNSNSIVNYMNIRDAYIGGRTNAITLYFKATSDSVAQYKDICSQYPFVMKTKPMPYGHPKILIGKQADDTRNLIKITENYVNGIKNVEVFWPIDGIVYCKVIPPRKLFIPVLPDKINGKLIFHLCTKCVLSDPNTFVDEECRHTDEERAIKRPFCTPELKEALAQGYKISEIFEIYSYNLALCNPNEGKEGLFDKYIQYFYKLKLESEGWPNDCESEEQKQEYINKIMEHENIQLEKERINKNSGMRQCAKLCLNSLYGKFGQRNNMPETIVIKNHSDLVSLLARLDIDIENLDLTFLTDTKILASYTFKTEFSKDLNSVNVAIASFITCYARLELYKHLKRLNRSTLYFDTDSIFWIEKQGGYTIPTGKFLGDFTCELAKYGKGAYISEAVFLGAKNYAFEVTIPGVEEKIYECKVRGFTLNYKNKAKINFDSMKKLLFEDISEIDIINDTIRTTKLSEIYSRKEKKTYSMVYNKRRRRVDNPMETFPFGF